MADPSNPTDQPPRAIQFQLSTIFVLTLVASILAAFLSPRGNDLMLAGMICVMGSLIFALVVGYLRPPLADRVFWGVVIAAMMQAVCAEVILLDRSGIYAWPLAAGLAAVVAAGDASLVIRSVLSSLTAAAIIAVYVISLSVSNVAIVSNVVCAAIGGALLTCLIDVVQWTSHRRRIPQPAIGLVLVLAAIGFSVAAPKWIPGW